MPYMMVMHVDKNPSREHQRRKNEPEALEVAAITPGVDDTLISNHRDVILQRVILLNAKGNIVFDQINVAHRSYDPLAYYMLFAFGDNGWYL